MNNQNSLYYGDNLNVLRQSIADESVDLIYLDPPFNSARDYNILFESPKGASSEAQITAFEDSWHWNQQAESEFNEIMRQSNTAVAEMMDTLRRFLGENDMMAYLTMMANRLLELHRVLKPTGNLYLHCDPTASHYLKIVLDGVFGKNNYRSEISWLRSQPKSHGTTNFSNCRDIIFRYAKSDKTKFFKVYGEYNKDYLKNFYKYQDSDGRIYSLDNLANPNKKRPNLTYEFLGVTRVWRWTKERMQKAWDDGLIVQSKAGTIPRFKRYLDEMHGQPITNNWSDIEHLHGSNDEFLGYPTQKPVALLERIIEASTNEGDVVLDPFCGCGTAVHAAQKLGRQWIGIDITHLAVSLIEKRLRDAFPDSVFAIEGTPKDLEGARDLANRDKYQFQWWACSLVNAQPYQGKKKGADGGIDGLIYFQDGSGDKNDKQHKKIIVSVKGGGSVNVAMVRDLAHVVKREKAHIGLFVTLTPPTKPMLVEAVKEGYYESPLFPPNAFPAIQILSVEGLLEGTERPRFPDLGRGMTTFKKAKLEEKTIDQKGFFDES